MLLRIIFIFCAILYSAIDIGLICLFKRDKKAENAFSKLVIVFEWSEVVFIALIAFIFFMAGANLLN